MIANQVTTPTVANPTPDKPKGHTCICCRIKFNSVTLQRDHFKTDWHLYNLKRKVCSLDPIDLDGYLEIQANNPNIKEDDTCSIFSAVSLRDIAYRPAYTRDRLDDISDIGSDWEEIDRDEFLDEDYDDKEKDELLSRMIQSDSCLFCDKKSSNVGKNLNHMNLAHGFFIPEERFLIDLDEIMEYLGFKVGAGSTCLWCNKQFSTTHGVRLHMIDKDHCKIFYDHERAIEEFKEYYDYSGQEQIDMKPLDQLVIVKKRHDRRTENSKLVPVDSVQILNNGGAYMVDSCQAKKIKKFEARRAKMFLKTKIANNTTTRGRFRNQNPI